MKYMLPSLTIYFKNINAFLSDEVQVPRSTCLELNSTPASFLTERIRHGLSA